MEKKQLNFDAPLLSVRKPISLCSLSNGQEKKSKSKSPPPMADLELEEVKKSGNVPFVWERIPGTPKNVGIKNLQVPTHPSSIPNLPPGRKDKYHPLNDHHSALIEILRESVYGNRESDSECADDVFSDTFDSMSLNCNSSSISGLSCDYEENDTNPSGTFNLDKQTGEFMMNRFLPASKAAAAIVETPQYVSKKRFLVSEQLMGPVVRPWMPSLKQGGDSNPSHQVLHPIGRNEHDKCGGKTSGFLPHLCMKNSLCIVKPMAIMKSNAPEPKSGTNDLTRFTRKASYSGPIYKNCRIRKQGLVRVDSKTFQPSRLSHSSVASCNNNMVTTTNPKSCLRPCVSMPPRPINDMMVNLQQEVEEVETDDKRECCDVNLQAPLPLRLPKSPADSWLWQTMHQIHSRNPDRYLNQFKKLPAVSTTKWETIVKTSHLHRSNHSFSEELVRHISH